MLLSQQWDLMASAEEGGGATKCKRREKIFKPDFKIEADGRYLKKTTVCKHIYFMSTVLALGSERVRRSGGVEK